MAQAPAPPIWPPTLNPSAAQTILINAKGADRLTYVLPDTCGYYAFEDPYYVVAADGICTDIVTFLTSNKAAVVTRFPNDDNLEKNHIRIETMMLLWEDHKADFEVEHEPRAVVIYGREEQRNTTVVKDIKKEFKTMGFRWTAEALYVTGGKSDGNGLVDTTEMHQGNPPVVVVNNERVVTFKHDEDLDEESEWLKKLGDGAWNLKKAGEMHDSHQNSQ